MKIGIITWFSGTNYGTHLQAIALQAFLREMNRHVEIINYEVDVPQKRPMIKRIMNQPRKFINNLAYKRFDSQIQLRNNKLKAIIKSNCILTDKIECDEEFVRKSNEFDLLICGGDQIWNPNWYHRFYYADYDAITTRKISYAPSIGVDEIPENQIENIRRSIEKFDYISIREKKGAEVVANLFDGEKKVEPVIDPAFLLNKNEWNEICKIKSKKVSYRYVLSMFLTDNQHHWKAAKRFADKEDCRLVVIPYCGFSYMQKAEIAADAGLEDVIALIREAEYILTDSFHITALAIIYHKQFYTFQRFKEVEFFSTNERVRNLLEIADCSNRFINYGAKRINDMTDINYKKIVPKLNKVIEESKKYLERAIGEE